MRVFALRCIFGTFLRPQQSGIQSGLIRRAIPGPERPNPMHSPETSPIRLTDMAVGQSGDLTQAIDDATPARLQELGFVEGTTVTLVRTGPLGDPVELELRGYRICLRRSDLAGLEVQLCREGAQ